MEKSRPNLVNPNYFVSTVSPVIKPKKKFSLNKIILICFILFTCFFLYNCKYGYFKITDDNGVIPYSLTNSFV